MSGNNGVFMLNEENKWDMLEELFSLPMEKRLEYLLKKAEEKKAAYLGQTDKTAPELATELIKKGVKAKSYGHRNKKEIKK